MRDITGKSVLALLLMASPAQGREIAVPDGPHVSTLGRGRVTVSADRAFIELTANGRDQSAAMAKSSVEEMIDTFLRELTVLKIPAEDYGVGGLALDREMEYRNDTEVPVGFLAERKVTLTLKDTSKIESVLQAALKAGINQVHSVEFSLSNWGEVKQRARSLAVTDAKNKAQFLAEQFGGCLGDIYSIDTSSDVDDGVFSEIVVTARKAQATMRVPEYVPGRYDSGQVEVKAQLLIVFNLRSRDCS
jgi:uncharacterized protein YggE